MKYAFMTFSCPHKSWAEVLDTASRAGYAGVEPRVGSGHAHGVEIEASAAQRREASDRARQAGIEICCLATGCKYADPAHAPAEIEQTRRYLDLAADLGCRRLRVFGGAYPESVSPQQATDGLVRALAAVAPDAAARNVTICVETHDSWTDPRVVADVMRRVNHPAIAVNWDVLHPLRQSGVSLQDAHATLRPWIRHVHVHDGSLDLQTLRLLPIGQGQVDHATVLRLLRDSGYDGYLSGEWIESIMTPEFFSTHLTDEIQRLRTLEKQAQ